MELPSNHPVLVAFKLRRYMSLVYNGFNRKVIPTHVCYSNRRLSLIAYQVEGGSNSSSGPGWRHFRLELATHLQILDEIFDKLPPGYKSGGGKLKMPVIYDLTTTNDD